MALSLSGHAISARESIAALSAAALAALAAGAWWMRRRKPDAEAMEARRRDHLFKVGRIIDGTVVDIRHESAVAHIETAVDNPEGAAQTEEAAAAEIRQLVSYRYRVSGVHYESAQDVTTLSAQMALATSSVGFPVSVRYDPANPANSIVVCEEWLGLHHNPITGRKPSGQVPRSRRESLRSAS